MESYDDKDISNHTRAVRRSENPNVPVVIRWVLSVPLVEIGLTDVPKSGGAMAPPVPAGTTPLYTLIYISPTATFWPLYHAAKIYTDYVPSSRLLYLWMQY